MATYASYEKPHDLHILDGRGGHHIDSEEPLCSGFCDLGTLAHAGAGGALPVVDWLCLATRRLAC